MAILGRPSCLLAPRAFQLNQAAIIALSILQCLSMAVRSLTVPGAGSVPLTHRHISTEKASACEGIGHGCQLRGQTDTIWGSALTTHHSTWQGINTCYLGVLQAFRPPMHEHCEQWGYFIDLLLSEWQTRQRARGWQAGRRAFDIPQQGKAGLHAARYCSSRLVCGKVLPHA